MDARGAIAHQIGEQVALLLGAELTLSRGGSFHLTYLQARFATAIKKSPSPMNL